MPFEKAGHLRLSDRYCGGRACRPAGAALFGRRRRVLQRAEPAAARAAGLGIPGRLGDPLRADGRGVVPDLGEHGGKPARRARPVRGAARGQLCVDDRFLPLPAHRAGRGCARSALRARGADHGAVPEDPPERRASAAAVYAVAAVCAVSQRRRVAAGPGGPRPEQPHKTKTGCPARSGFVPPGHPCVFFSFLRVMRSDRHSRPRRTRRAHPGSR
mgnify:CR=1 FL=1